MYASYSKKIYWKKVFRGNFIISTYTQLAKYKSPYLPLFLSKINDTNCRKVYNEQDDFVFVLITSRHIRLRPPLQKKNTIVNNLILYKIANSSYFHKYSGGCVLNINAFFVLNISHLMIFGDKSHFLFCLILIHKNKFLDFYILLTHTIPIES